MPSYGHGADTANQRRIVYHRSGTPSSAGNHRCLFTSSGTSSSLSESATARVAPHIAGPFEIVERLSAGERQARRAAIQAAFQGNQGGPRSNEVYLEEAYYFVPVHLALQLQQRGHYVAALDWLRTVYDYGAPPAQRKIFFGLKREESLSATLDRAADWLLDPLDPHLIAATRPNAYTRFTVLASIRCLLEFADTEFTRDTAESVPRARTLYLTALELLGVPELSPPPAASPIAPSMAPASGPTTLATTLERNATLVAEAETDLAANPALATAVQTVGAVFVAAPLTGCVPPNRIVDALRLHAELNLYKLRNGRNIAGLERQIELYAAPLDGATSLPIFGGGQLARPGAIVLRPTPYRYAVLIERAKQLVNLAQQMEAAMLAAFEKRDAEAYNLLKARQDVRLSQSTIRVQDLRVREAEGGVNLAQLQQQRAQIQVDHVQALLDVDLTDLEKAALGFLIGAGALHLVASGLSFAAAFPNPFKSLENLAQATSSLAAAASTTAQIFSTYASYERR